VAKLRDQPPTPLPPLAPPGAVPGPDDGPEDVIVTAPDASAVITAGASPLPGPAPTAALGPPKKKGAKEPQRQVAGICQEHHRHLPHKGLHRFRVRATNAECPVGKYILAPDAESAKQIYVESEASHLSKQGFDLTTLTRFDTSVPLAVRLGLDSKQLELLKVQLELQVDELPD
jgi:hypothetical protein